MKMKEVTENYTVGKIQQIKLIKGITSGRVSLQMIVHTLYCIEIDTPFTIILFCINSALYHSFLPPNHISSLIPCRDFDTFFKSRKDFFDKHKL
jgi:hypothetical protein